MSAYKDAQGKNDSSRNAQQYTDLDLFFGKKTVGSDVNKITDIQAVKRSIRNLVLLNVYDKPFHPEIAGGITEMLFEPMTLVTAQILARKVEDVIINFEPRARLIGVRATPNLDRNEYNITIHFYVVNAPTELVEFDLILERLR